MNIFDYNVDALVNPVNCVGVSGAGLAKAFRLRFPECYRLYVFACRRGELRPGHVFTACRSSAPYYIIYFPTKRHWQEPSRLEYVESGLNSLIEAVRTHKISSIAIPALGCGLGGLEWNKVHPLLERFKTKMHEITVVIVPPLEYSYE